MTGTGLTPDQRRALASVLDEIIPPSEDGNLPGAGSLGLADYVLERAAEMVPLVVQGLAALHEIAAARGGGFADLGSNDKLEALNELATREPGFLPGLVFHTYTGYYQDGRVIEALGVPPRAPHPLGYELDTGDLSLLDPVRERAPLYRAAPRED